MIEIKKTIRGTLPRIPFARIARTILGPHYDLSLVVSGDTLARTINKRYRHRAYAANVLSFPISKTEGEIFLNAHAAAREAKRFHVSHRARLALLFIHGCLHLKGFLHGATMERMEQKILRGINAKRHNARW